MTGQYSRRLSDLREGDLERVGGKALNLGLLVARGLPAVDGFVVQTNAWSVFAQQAGLEEDLPSRAGGYTQAQHERLCRKVLSSPFPADLTEELSERWALLGGRPFVCRSSAVCEDGPARSYAGHYESWLNLRDFEQLIRAVKLCWCSLYEPHGSAYGGAAGQSDGMAVVVQPLVIPMVSGVLFTGVRSESGPAVGVEAVYGLGEGLVAGILRPDRYLLDWRSGEVIHREIVPQVVMLYPNLTEHQFLYGDPITVGGETHQVFRQEPFSRTLGVMLNRSWYERGTLTAKDLGQLWASARRAEETFGAPQDVEWVIDDRRELLILQTRPITAAVDWVYRKSDDGRQALCGIAASSGEATGPVQILHPGDSGEKLREGGVLVAFQTYPQWFFGMARAAAVVTEVGGILSHAAIVARELHKPCVVGATQATRRLKDGALIHVDGSRGLVSVVQTPSPGGEPSTGDRTPALDSRPVAVGCPEREPIRINGVVLLHQVMMEHRVGEHPEQTAERVLRERIEPGRPVTYVPCHVQWKAPPDTSQNPWVEEAMRFAQGNFGAVVRQVLGEMGCVLEVEEV